MNTTNNTVLITGGSAGIGFAIAKLLASSGNKVIITGRDRKRLDDALEQLPGVTGIQGDVSKQADQDLLVQTLAKNFPGVNVVINNAGKAHLHDLAKKENAFEKASDEMMTNYLSIVSLNEKLLPLLEKQKEAAIINVSSIVAIVPASIQTYSASKAALHSYTQSLRISLQRTGSIKVFELMPPLVNTALSAAIGGENGIAPSIVADDLLSAMQNDIFEIHVGNTKDLYELYLKSPGEALKMMQPAA